MFLSVSLLELRNKHGDDDDDYSGGYNVVLASLNALNRDIID